ncbi:MAG: acyl carrier protein [Polyangiales bacterium]
MIQQGRINVNDEIKSAVKEFILSEFLPGENPDELTETTPLITGGILDSIATMKVVLFIEERFNVIFEAHEVDRENFDSIANIVQLVSTKRSPDHDQTRRSA